MKLDEKRIERQLQISIAQSLICGPRWKEDWKPDVYAGATFKITKTRWKEDWKCGGRFSITGRWHEVARWKEDWKIHFAPCECWDLYWNSMKRGLKDKLFITTLNSKSSYLDEKRIESCHFRHELFKCIIVYLDEKRIESLHLWILKFHSYKLLDEKRIERLGIRFELHILPWWISMKRGLKG